MAEEKMDPKDFHYKNVFEFVDKFLVVMYPTTGNRLARVAWSPCWWKHAEVVARFDALWKRYEYLRAKEPDTALETFLRVHGDYHMRQIMKDDGVFADCKREDIPSVPLPVQSPKKKKSAA
ncbi:TPA: DUF4913 domain-containing protein [Corynebacterium striatum]|nr:DUF4913 domain-containing protein [Corynebacterium striatum]HAT6564305.1 DUF4913 domain-containing protein [Corynebacterium striatum]HAT6569767.1 DUF4913 domain-containing protein [Corynebacterium striatum]